MNYIDLIDGFWRKNLTSPITCHEAYLYFYLLKECKSHNWENPFRLPTRKICVELNFRKDKITSIRDSLKQKGLIDFKKGDRNSLDPEYTIICDLL